MHMINILIYYLFILYVYKIGYIILRFSRSVRNTLRQREQGLLDLIHSDVWGPAQTATFGGCRYYVIFIDDLSRHNWIYPMRHKSEVFEHFQRFKKEVEKDTSRHVRCLRSDGDKEYFSDDFTACLRKEGIRREFTCRHTPCQEWYYRQREKSY